jgi:hypothetical protein
MSRQPNTTLACGECSNPVQKDAEYCPSCGAMFKEGFHCTLHRSRDAEGICVICRKPFRHECGSDVQNVFFCNHHSRYEFHEGMARVYGHTDNVQVQYTAECLRQAGFHPFLFSRKFNPGPDIARWIPLRVYGQNTIAELKVLVLFSEVLEAEKTLKRLSLFSLKQAVDNLTAKAAKWRQGKMSFDSYPYTMALCLSAVLAV